MRQLQNIAEALERPLIELIFPKEAKALSKANQAIPELMKENEDLPGFKSKVEQLLGFITSFVATFEQMGFTGERFKAQLDPDGRLEAYTQEKLLMRE